MDFFSTISYLHPFDELDLKDYFASLSAKLAYHLERRIPKGAKVMVLFPKSLLSLALPVIKNHAEFVIVGANLPGFAHSGSVNNCDLILGEPLGFSDEGYIVPHAERALWNSNLLACCSLAQKASVVPSECDLVHGSQLVCEKGVFNFENLSFTPNL